MSTPAEIHGQDQMQASLRMLAALVHAYYAVLRDEGFDDYQAMDLTARYQDHLLNLEDEDPEA